MQIVKAPLFTRVLGIAASVAVALALVLLPITSLPRLASLVGGPLVAPPSVVFLFVLAVGWLPIYLLKNGILPGEMKPWLVFSGMVLVSIPLSYFLPVPAYKNHSILSAGTDALLTFGIALTAYVIFSTWIQRPGQLRWVLGWINLGGLVLVTWSLAQLYFILVSKGAYPGWMVKVQAFLSWRSLQEHVYYTRIAGFAYEPSWLAHQLNVVYIPFWLAATATGYSTFKKLRRVSCENILLVGGVVVLVFTYSRVGLLAFLLVLAYGAYRLNEYGIRWLLKRFTLRNRSARVWVTVFAIPIVLGLYFLLVFSLLTYLGSVDPRIAKLLEFRDFSTNLMNFAFRTDFAERVIYWSNGWLGFTRYPFFGVGLGNAGFFFPEHLHLLGYRSNEIMQVLNEEMYLPNIKSLWVRILAETGLAGFSLFVAGYYLMWQAGQNLARQLSPLFRAMGWMGSFVLISFLVEGFSIDSFALPYLWVSLGLLTATSAMSRRVASGSAF